MSNVSARTIADATFRSAMLNSLPASHCVLVSAISSTSSAAAISSHAPFAAAALRCASGSTVALLA
jgi:hypothetical protein